MNFYTILNELVFSTSRSSGPGGQHVNKTESRVSLQFSIRNSLGLTENEKHLVLVKASQYISGEGVLQIHCQKFRSQHKNKQAAIDLLEKIIRESIKTNKKRIPTKLPKSIIEKRLKVKRNVADKKKLRKKINKDDVKNIG